MDTLHGYMRIIGYKDGNGQLLINYYDFFEFDLCTRSRDCSMEEFSAGILDNVESAIEEIVLPEVGYGEMWEFIGEVKENDKMCYIGQHEFRPCTVQDLNDAFNKPTLNLIYGSVRDGKTLKAA